jgi:hypothetical protein
MADAEREARIRRVPHEPSALAGENIRSVSRDHQRSMEGRHA